MPTYSKQALSGSTNGRQIKVAATSSAGTTIHTAVTGTSDFDEIWLWAVNSSNVTIKLTIEFGGTSAPDDNIEVSITGESGYVLVVPGLILQNDLVVKAFAGTGDVILIGGFVNRITA